MDTPMNTATANNPTRTARPAAPTPPRAADSAHGREPAGADPGQAKAGVGTAAWLQGGAPPADGWPDGGGGAGGAESPLAVAANVPGVDPCDVACDAMPAHVIGDLTPPDQDWILGHTSDCGYCSHMLHRYERIDEMLSRLNRRVVAEAVPPPFRPPLSAATRGVRPLRRAHYGTMDSPLGPLLVAVTEAGVCEIGFAVSESEADFRCRLAGRGLDPEPGLDLAGTPGATAVAAQLREYFGGRRDRFEVPLDFAGVSPFTRSVLAATAEVPFGHLSTYREIAARVGSPKATRAVGNALGRNPLPVIVPCHRIVRSDASLGGYTGGVGIKQRLLALEGVALGMA
jgi:methylated-DNA-[protein]-cysteine S-methyltransferase